MFRLGRIALAFAFAAAASCAVKTDEPITVAAASSLEDVTRDLNLENVRFQYGGSSALARQLMQGAPAHVFITAHPQWLEGMKVLDRFDWMSNRLVVVVPRSGADAALKDLESIVLAGEETPAGRYARDALRAMGVALPKRVVLGANVRDTLSKVSHGAAQAGIVYETDAAVDSGVRVSLKIDPAFYPQIRYTVGLLREEGRGVFNALRSAKAAEAVRRRGFIPL